MNHRWLARRYNTFNRLYWKGRLPNNTIIVELAGLPKEVQARTYYLANGPVVIAVSNRIAWDNQMEMALLHEMAHISTKGNRHGKKWQAEMRRLVRLKAFDNLW